MPNNYNHYNVFVSSPGDVRAERAVCIDVIQKISVNVAESLRLTLIPLNWEQLAPEAQIGDRTVQEQLNELVRKADIFVLILGDRYGTIEKAEKLSNTEREVKEIFAKKRRDSRVTVLCYFKHLEPASDPGPQRRKTTQFKRRLSKLGVLSREYIDHTDLEKSFVHDLYALAIRLRSSPFKTECISHFLVPSDGSQDISRRQESELALIYRPVLRKFEDESKDVGFWHKRLMPSVVFEDSRAIQKLQKLARMQGIACKVFMVYELPANINFMDRVWICAPRMPKAMETARHAKACFSFKKTDHQNLLLWRRGSKILRIHSPLAKYVREQRNLVDMDGEWTSRLGNIVAKDFAVLARIPSQASGTHAAIDETYDYFISGVRGLGTWGAAWYLDRKFKELRSLKRTGRIELLLEVTYRNGAIHDVIDVTRQPIDYFEQQNRLDTIRNVIEDRKSQ